MSDQQRQDISDSILRPQPVWKMPILFTSFIGREQDVADICTLLKQPAIRLLTILGPGGIGKTRLSVQVATELRDAFTDGICFIHLAAIYDHHLVVSAIAEGLEIREIGAQSLIEQVKLSLHDRSFLLVLDNFEQVSEATPRVEELLIACPGLKVLVTSRVVLHMRGEQEYPVSSLSLPNLKLLPEGESLLQCAAVALFVQRARAVLPSFQVNSTNARTVAEICVRLDGFPLAIELAAARIKLLPPQALLARLSQRLLFLISSTRALPERQQTLRNTLKWSYDLLDAHEQQFFRRLSVFAGGWTLEAAETVVGRTIERAGFSALDGISSLLDKSLLLQIKREGDEPYLVMLETIREYGMECLVESGEAAFFQHAHALYYLAWVEEAEPHLKDAQQLVWLARLDHEQENLRAALQWFIDHQKTELALRFGGALWWFWYIRGYYSEGQRWLETVLKLPHAEVQAIVRAKSLCGAGRLTYRLGNTLESRSLLEESVAIYRELGDKRGLSESLVTLGWTFPATIRTLMEESLALAQEIGDKWILGLSLQGLGWCFLFQDDFERAYTLLQKSAHLFREVGDKNELAITLLGLPWLIVGLRRDYVQAAASAQEGLSLAREMDNKPGIVEALHSLCQAASWQGEYAQAITYAQENLFLAKELGDKSGIARSLGQSGEIALYQGDLSRAAILLEESLALYRELDNPYNIAVTLNLLADIKRLHKDLHQALKLYRESLSLGRSEESKNIISLNLIGFGKVAVEEGQPKRAAHLFGAAESWVDLGNTMSPAEHEDYQLAVEKMRAELGDEVLLAASNRGKTMTLEQVLAVQEQDFIIEPNSDTTLTSVTETSPIMATYPDDLTAREVEVLRLLARGWTDTQIATHMVISPRTVNTHLTSVYRKLQISSRSAATRYALEKKLI